MDRACFFNIYSSVLGWGCLLDFGSGKAVDATHYAGNFTTCFSYAQDLFLGPFARIGRNVAEPNVGEFWCVCTYGIDARTNQYFDERRNWSFCLCLILFLPLHKQVLDKILGPCFFVAIATMFLVGCAWRSIRSTHRHSSEWNYILFGRGDFLRTYIGIVTFTHRIL